MKNLSLAMPTITVRRGCLFGHYPPRSIKSEYGCYKEWDEEIEASAMVLKPFPARDVIADAPVYDAALYFGVKPEFL